MDEARKTNSLRGEEFIRRYFSGSVIDIGCGPDLVVPHAVSFDVEQGDVQWILNYFEPESFDCVHSSHCLGHMRNVESALAQWWGLVKQGGHMVIVVPDEDLYEQGIWPSLFNPDHKATFNLGKQNSWSPVSRDLGALVRALPDAEIIEACVHDKGYDRRLMPKSLTRNSLLRSAPGEPSSEQLDGGDVEPARGAFDGCFEVLGKAAVAVEPSDGSLDHPPARQELEPLGGI